MMVANVGSTSFKYRLLDMSDESILAEGRIERIGSEESPVAHSAGDHSHSGTHPMPGFADAIRWAIERLTDEDSGVIGEMSEIDAVGFKTVHLKDEPGCYLLTEDVMTNMEAYNSLAPAHNPSYVAAIRLMGEICPGTPLVGLFEPAFHTTMPDCASTYGVPWSWREKHGVKRYGFHGASHRYISQRAPQIARSDHKKCRMVSCHLGGSSSLCAIVNGASVDTTMGVSPQAGIENGNRCGDLDVFAVLYVMDQEGYSTDDVRKILGGEGGLAGISGTSGDVRDLEEAIEQGSERAQIARDVFCYQVKKTIGAYTAAMGGLDLIAFAGGIGERGTKIREKICEGLSCIGVEIDTANNAALVGSEGEIGLYSAPVRVVVVNTNEELIVAREVVRALSDN